MDRTRRPCLTMVLAAVVTMILFGCLCGLSLRVIYRPPFLTWQHGAEFPEPVAAYLREQFSLDWHVRVAWVKEYTDTCSVVRVAVRDTDSDDQAALWVLLFRAADGSTDWQVDHTESDAGLAPALAWGSVCGEGAGGLTLPDFEPLLQATLVVP